jgi:SAM-dependent methyltransferase
MSEKKSTKGYLHGFTPDEQDRLRRQARIVEFRVHGNLPFQRARRLLELGCGVGGQTEILLRRYPDLHVTGVDASKSNLEAAANYLADQPVATGRYELVLGDVTHLELEANTFDAAFLCWILEHVADPVIVLAEARRLLRSGSPIVVSEVLNATFFLSPYSPCTLAYWTAFNDHQFELGGDPFVGAKLGNLLQRVGFRDIVTEVKTVHIDNREPAERQEFIAFWTELLLSGAPGLLDAGRVSAETVEGMKTELGAVAHDPDAVIFYSFIQARARVD